MSPVVLADIMWYYSKKMNDNGHTDQHADLQYCFANNLHREGKITYSLQTPCLQDSDCSDEDSCTVDRCDLSSGTCHNSMLSNCCGNDVCEVNEEECSADCGPWSKFCGLNMACIDAFKVFYQRGITFLFF